MSEVVHCNMNILVLYCEIIKLRARISNIYDAYSICRHVKIH